MDQATRLTVQADAKPAQEDVTAKAISAALGGELRRAREAKGWTRAQFVALLPSGIGERTLLAYEHGLRQLTVTRLAELCDVLDVMPTTLMTEAFQRARIHLANLPLRVDLRVLINDSRNRFRPLVGWAKNKLNECPSGIAEVAPSSVAEFATLMGHKHEDVAEYLARFLPEPASGDTDAAVVSDAHREPG